MKRVKLQDPRKVGGRYYCGYWRKEYKVLDIKHDVPIWGTEWIVEWEDGMLSRHSTGWDERVDRVIAD